RQTERSQQIRLSLINRARNPRSYPLHRRRIDYRKPGILFERNSIIKTMLVTIRVTLRSAPTFVGYSQDRVLVFTKTAGFRHKRIPKGVATVTTLLQREGISVVHSEDSRYFCTDSLSQFGAVLFLSTTGNILDNEQKAAFQQFIRSGK